MDMWHLSRMKCRTGEGKNNRPATGSEVRLLTHHPCFHLFPERRGKKKRGKREREGDGILSFIRKKLMSIDSGQARMTPPSHPPEGGKKKRKGVKSLLNCESILTVKNVTSGPP